MKLLLLPVELVMHGGSLLEIAPGLPEEAVGHVGGIRIRGWLGLVIAGTSSKWVALLQLLQLHAMVLVHHSLPVPLPLSLPLPKPMTLISGQSLRGSKSSGCMGHLSS